MAQILQQTTGVNAENFSAKEKTVQSSGNPFHIIMILDKSGSMQSISQKIISAINEFVQEQKHKAPDSVMSLITFSSGLSTVYEKLPISQVPTVTSEMYQPDGMTALYDAIGLSLIKFREDKRAVVVVVTDGEENSSNEFPSMDKVQVLIDQQKAAGWNFIFLANGLDVAKQGTRLGIANAASCMKKSKAANLAVNYNMLGEALSRQVSDAVAACYKRGEMDNPDYKQAS